MVAIVDGTRHGTFTLAPSLGVGPKKAGGPVLTEPPVLKGPGIRFSKTHPSSTTEWAPECRLHTSDRPAHKRDRVPPTSGRPKRYRKPE